MLDAYQIWSCVPLVLFVLVWLAVDSPALLWIRTGPAMPVQQSLVEHLVRNNDPDLPREISERYRDSKSNIPNDPWNALW